jgi:hypothetical protein
MQVAFPYPVKVQASTPKLVGLRFSPFTNIDNESFATPSLNGRWELDINLAGVGMRGQLALSSFVTQMETAGATCDVPVCVQWRPNDANGRMLVPNGLSPEWTFDHVGFANDPFEGFTLRAAASHRDSYIDVDKPALSQLWPGHYITLGDRLHQVVNVSAIEESETAIRVSVMPNIRGDYDLGELVVVDQLRLKCRMETGDQVGGFGGPSPVRRGSISLVEAF